MLQNEEVCGITIYSSSEASGVDHIIHRSRRLRWIMICFENMVLPRTSELCSYISYQVEMVRYSHNCFVIWRPRDTISAQTNNTIIAQ